MIHKRKKECIRCGKVYYIIWEDGKSFVEYNLCPECRAIMLMKHLSA